MLDGFDAKMVVDDLLGALAANDDIDACEDTYAWVLLDGDVENDMDNNSLNFLLDD